MRNLIAISLFFLAVVAVAITIPLVRSCHALPPQNEEVGKDGEFSLVVIGEVKSDGETTKMFAIRKGDVLSREKEAFYWCQGLSHYGLNATIYHPYPLVNSSSWKTLTYKRPKGMEQIFEWRDDPSKFGGEKEIAISELPAPFKFFSEKYLSKIEFVIEYMDGGTKIYLRNGTTEDEAREMLALFLAYHV